MERSSGGGKTSGSSGGSGRRSSIAPEDAASAAATAATQGRRPSIAEASAAANTSTGANSGTNAGGGNAALSQGKKPQNASLPKGAKETASPLPLAPASKTVALFGHLPQFDRSAVLAGNASASITSHLLRSSRETLIHPAIIRLGLAYANYSVMGANERCRQMLMAFKQVFKDYQAPVDQAISRHMEAHLRPLIAFLVQARPLAVAMGHAIRHLKLKISTLPPDTTEAEAPEFMCAVADNYLRNRLDLADELISQHGCTKISDGDVLLTFAHSSVVARTLIRAHSVARRRFRVIVVDSRPFLEGRRMLKQLVQAGIECSYLHLNAIGHVMKEVTKVWLGAHALFSNGALLSRVGTASIALLARTANKPVIVCCETLKFSENMQLDSVVYNELGDPDALIPAVGHAARSHLADWRALPPNLKLLNVLYDVTPPEVISLVISEVGLIPVTSIPVVLREYNSNTSNTSSSSAHPAC
jgi:translation initiation factor eIF-2B subunit delta